MVVVVFDEPEILTKAKREEQHKRDASRTTPAKYHSSDIAPVPADDDYDGAALRAVRNCHEILASRPARSRFYDAIGVELVRCLGAELAATAAAQASQAAAGAGGSSAAEASPTPPDENRARYWGLSAPIYGGGDPPPPAERPFRLVSAAGRVCGRPSWLPPGDPGGPSRRQGPPRGGGPLRGVGDPSRGVVNQRL